MDEAKLTDLATTIADRLCGTHERLCVTLMRHLAAGQPVSAAHLAADLAIDEPAVGALLRQLSDVDYDAAGHDASDSASNPASGAAHGQE
jgi:hypothetical protein